jgi:glycolate oxidase iron-sulfur subunit
MTTVNTAFDAHHPPARELLDDCVHCGFCLPACPTYVLWGEEADSPRGRILLMDAAARGELSLTPDLVRHWDACLGCMACVTACPSGVRYDRLIEQTRQQVERRHRRGLRDRARRAAVFALFPHPRRMRAAAALLVAYRASGLRALLRRAARPGRGGLLALAPAVPARAVTARLPRRLPATTRPAGAPQRVVLLTGCVQHGLFGDVNQATARVLAAYGCEVVVPPGQGCCGALELHAGREAQARRRATRLMQTLSDDRAALIAVNSAGCGSVMKEYATLLADDADPADPADTAPGRAAQASAASGRSAQANTADAAAAFAARVRDVSEILAELGPPPGALHPLPLRVAYHDACHLAHAQGIREQPRRMLQAIPGLDLVPLAEPDMCCGSAGIHNLTQPAAAAALGRRKAEHVRSAGPDALCAANPGCLLQISAHLPASHTNGIPTFHPVELLDASLRAVPAAELTSARRRLQRA